MDITRQLEAEIEMLLDANRVLTEAINQKTTELENKTRDLEVEEALEKVRAAAMSMQRSDELREIVATIYDQLRHLGFTYGACGIIIMDKKTGDMNWWMAGFGKDGYPENYHIPFFDHRFYLDQLNHWKAGEKFVEIEVSGDEKKSYDEIIFTKTDFARIPEEARKIMSAFTKITFSMAYMKHGALSWGTDPINIDHANILQRFAVVFEQAYTRFNDLKQSEAQTREAKIETALERIRSKTMGMQKSDELREVVATMYDQLQFLDITFGACTIIIIDKDTQNMQHWVGGFGQKIYPESYQVPYFDHPFIATQLSQWKSEERYAVLELSGENKKSYDAFMFNQTEFKNFPEGDKKWMQEIGSVTFSIAYMKHGALTWGPNALSEEYRDILQRFAKVFDQTYTRFLDLKLAEAHAIQAEEDLIKLHTEKKRAEEALIELRTTQAQLIQSEKMASLGELTAGIAHEIQNPLNFVNNFSEVSNELIDEMLIEVVNGNYDEVKSMVDDIKQNLLKINQHGKRAEGIVKGMLQHSRSSASQKELTNINRLADEYLHLAYHGLRAKDKSFNAILKMEYDETISSVMIIPHEIGRVILNLINNAFYAVSDKFSYAKASAGQYEPTVLVSTRKTLSIIEISVKDNGNGIQQKILDKIFQPFFTTKPAGKGTGLGLSLAYDIIKAHGGELRVNTTEGEGSEFIIQLPIILPIPTGLEA